MSICILGGQLSGLKLFVPSGNQTRPTSVLLRRKIFDSKQDLTGYHFYDLCAGTGAMGLEACSRGAKSVTFVENHPKSTQILQKNIKLVEEKLKKLEKRCQLRLKKQSFQAFATQFKSGEKGTELAHPSRSIIFFDPPYDRQDLYQLFIETFIQTDHDYGLIWIESDDKNGLDENWWKNQGFSIGKFYKHSASFLVTID